MMLGSGKSDIERVLGKPTMTPNMLGIPDEKAWAYRAGPFDILISYVAGIARAMAVRRVGGPLTPLSPPEYASALALNAPAVLWEIKVGEDPVKLPTKSAAKSKVPANRIATPPALYFSYVARDPKIKDKVLTEIFGWMPGDKPYAFFFLPVLDAAPPVLASEWAVRQKLG